MKTISAALLFLVLPCTAAAQDRFVGTLPEPSQIRITKDVEYAKDETRALKFDLYRPASTSAAVPVVVMLNGIGAEWMRQHVQYTGWAQFVTTRGFAGVTMDSTEGVVAADFDRLVAYLRTNASTLGVDPSRIVVWACSANVRAALPLVSDPARAVAGAVMYYGTGDVSRFRPDVPLLMVRAGVDNPGLNQGIDGIVSKAAAANAPVSLINYPAGRHGFDVRDDNDLTRAVLSQTLDFMTAAVDPRVSAALRAGTDVAEAAAALSRQDWDTAIRAYESLTNARPKESEFAQRLGAAYAGKGDFAKAAANYERALELNTPDRGIVTFGLVRANTKLNQIEKAFEWLEKLKPMLRFFRQRLVDDPDFAPLRADARFKSLIGS